MTEKSVSRVRMVLPFDGSGVGRDVEENFEHQFLRPDKPIFLTNLGDRPPFPGGLGQGGDRSGPQLEGLRGGLFAGLDPGLVVGVDAEEAGVESDGPFEEGDQHADGQHRPA